MKRQLTKFLLLLILLPNLLMAGVQNLWTLNGIGRESIASQHGWVPTTYSSLSLNLNAIKSTLQTAPDFQLAGAVPITISLPMPDGSFESFAIFEIPVMHPDLQKQFPGIRTFGGNGIEHPLWSVRCDFTQFGFHGYINTEKGTVLIDPLSLNNTNDYLIYYKHLSGQHPKMVCELADENINESITKAVQNNTANRSTTNALRTYRLAMAATGEYTAFYGGTVAGGLAGIVTSVNRVDGIYMRELDVHFVLVPNNNLLVYTNAATDPYTNSSGGTMLGENQTNVTAVIGTANYDVGHVFSTGGGGIASLGVICSATNKARGVTGLPSPIGDPFDVDYVAHEMGHQFAGNHTFNSATGSCAGGNRSAANAYEVGSGITIQAYAGICGTDNIAPNSIAYFHTRSFDEMYNHVTIGGGSTCPVVTNPVNSAPVINTITGNYSIPYLTAFKLTATGTDPDLDPITYSWEQYDLGPAGAWNAPSGNAPIFRSYAPSLSGERIFPKLSNILSNTTSIGEIYPTYARNLQFRVTLRDEKNTGGGVTYNDTPVLISVINTGSTFAVTYPNAAGISLDQVSCPVVTWNVAGTDLAPISTSGVNIFLSVDGGNTFPYTLASNVPNSGSATVKFPANVSTTAGRIMIQGAGNIYFDINDNNFAIVNPLAIIGNTPFCAGSVNTIKVNGAYTSYNWSNGSTTQAINVSNSATYTVTVTNANGCTGSVSVTTTVVTLTPAITGNLTPCTGSSTTLSTGVYSSYLWSTGATTQSIVVSANGTYIVTVTNSAGCTATATAKVVKKTRPVIAVTPADANLCPPATSVALTASGNAATYSWSPATGLNVTTGTAVTASPAATTSYTVTGTSTFGCTTTAAAKITVKPKPINLTTTNILATSAQANWTIVDCATGYTVQYRLAGGTWLSVQVNTNIGTRTLTGLQASTSYQWRIKAKYPNGTTGAYTSPVNFTTPALRIGETATVNALQVYPNPATDKLNLEFPFTEGDATIKVVNALGQTVLTQRATDTDGVLELNIQSLTEGLYFVTVKNGDNTFNTRFVKN